MEEVFFNKIAPFYDEMIDFTSALERRSIMLQKFIIPGMEYAADIGCGTGLDSISLAKSGLKVRAFDPSDGMIEQAKKNSETQGVKIKYYNAGFNNIPEIFNSSFDLAVSLGNTTANIPQGDIEASIMRLHQLLKEDGRAVIQILNYERLRNKNERIVNVTKYNQYFYVRFYDFFDDYLNFNILTFNSENTKERSLHTTPLYPYSSDYLKNIFEKMNFNKIELFGSLNQDAFERDSSPDLVLSAFK